MALMSNNSYPSMDSYYALGKFLIAFHLPINLTKQEVTPLPDVPHLEGYCQQLKESTSFQLEN